MTMKMNSENLRAAVELDVLPNVTKPGRYSGGELNSVSKPGAPLRMALCFPEVYEIAMSNLGFLILYHLVNETTEYSCERCFAPWPDMEEALRSRSLPLYSLESFTPLCDFDIAGFSLSYEMTYTNILTMLELGGVPLRAEDRREGFPLVIAGGVCAVNPEPIADFFDAIVIGEGEEVLPEILNIAAAAKKSGAPKTELLESLSKLEGVYVPALRNARPAENGTIIVDGPPVSRRYIEDMSETYIPLKTVLPGVEAVHDRINLELFRGCVRGCRYCQAGMIYRPMRERSAKKLAAAAETIYRNLGCDEITLLSLNSTDYSQLIELLDGVGAFSKNERLSLSLPSTRVDTFSAQVGDRMRLVRSTGLTLAPEAGTQRLRDAINKNITDDDIEKAVRYSVASGFDRVKLYFMIGLPFETEEDVFGIASLVARLLKAANSEGGGKRRRRFEITASVSNFVPKPHTPFQWAPMDPLEKLREKQSLLRRELREKRAVKLDFHDPVRSRLEAVFARGDRRLSRVIEAAWRKGCRFDGWSDFFKVELWNEAFDETGLSADSYASAAFEPGAALPWSHIATGVSEKFFVSEWENAKEAVATQSCLDGACSACGLKCR